MERGVAVATLAAIASLASRGAVPALAAPVHHVKVFLVLDGTGHCLSRTPGIVEVHPNDTIAWEIVDVRTRAGKTCPPGTKVALDFPSGVLDGVAATDDRPARAVVDEDGFTREKRGLDSTFSAPDRDQLRRLPSRPLEVSPSCSARLTAKVVTRQRGLYKYNVRIAGGAVEDPPIKVTPP